MSAPSLRNVTVGVRHPGGTLACIDGGHRFKVDNLKQGLRQFESDG